MAMATATMRLPMLSDEYCVRTLECAISINLYTDEFLFDDGAQTQLVHYLLDPRGLEPNIALYN